MDLIASMSEAGISGITVITRQLLYVAWQCGGKRVSEVQLVHGAAFGC